MKKVILCFLIIVHFTVGAQTDSVSLLRKRVDSLQARLDEKNYTRVPNKDLEDAFRTKVKEEVNGWFSSNALLGGGILAGLIALMLTVARRMVTKELDEKLKTYVSEKTEDISKRFDEHRKAVKEDFADLKISINSKLVETQHKIKEYHDESNELVERYKKNTEESFGDYVDDKIKQTNSKVSEFQNELNETVTPLFNQVVDAILLRTNKTDRNEKDEELINYLEKLFKRGKLPSEKSAAEALDALVTYYYYRLNTAKMEALISEYGNKYNLSATCYANAALAFLDKYEANNQIELKNSCVSYCDQAIRKLFNYGIAYYVKIMAFFVEYTRAFSEAEKEAALNEIKKIFNQVSFINSQFIAEDILKEFDAKDSYLKEYAELLRIVCMKELQELQDKADKFKKRAMEPPETK